MDGLVRVEIPEWRLRAGKPRVALVQCQLPLRDFAAEEGRVRISRDRDDYVASLYAALDVARKREASFCIFPEYAWPAMEASRLVRTARDMPDGSMIVAPFEHLSLNEYTAVLHDAGVSPHNIEDEIRDAKKSVEFVDRAIVNACLVILKVNDSVIVHPQRKLRPARLEEETYSGRWSFVSGSSVRIFCGHDGIAVAVLLCFDFISRDPHNDFEPLGDLATQGLTYIFVPECNPGALHPTYLESLTSVFRSVHPPQAVFFVNVAEQTPLPIKNPQLGFSSVVGQIGEVLAFDGERAILVEGFLQNKSVREISELKDAEPSLPHPAIRTLIIRTEPTLALFDLPRIGGNSSVNIRETRAATEVSLYRLVPDVGWRRVYRLAHFQLRSAQSGVPPGYLAQEWGLIGVEETQQEFVSAVQRTNDRPIWVTGAGGTGKTALVADTLHRFFAGYRVVWIDLGDLEYTDEALRERLLIAVGAAPVLAKNEASKQVEALQKILGAEPTILVLDSYDRWEVGLFPPWLPQLLSGWMPRIVITSRERSLERSGDARVGRDADPQIAVRKLTVDEAQVLIDAVSKQNVARHDVEVIAEVTDRSALACVWFGELLRYAPVEARQLIGRLDPAKPGLQSVYDAMLHGVTPEARMLVGVVCQLPAPVPRSDLEQIIGCSRGKLKESIGELKRRSLIMKREGGWQPRHPYVKLYWREPQGDEEFLVRRTAERSRIFAALLTWAADLLDRWGGELNFDGYDLLEDRWINIGYLLRRLTESNSPDDWRLFLSLWDRADTFLWTKARWRERLALGRNAEKFSRDLDDKRSLGKAWYESIAEVLFHRYGPSEQIIDYLDRAATVFDELGDLVHRARIEWYRSRVFAEGGDFERALDVARSAVAIAERSGDIRTIGLAHHGLGNVHRRRGNAGEALEEFERGRQYFEQAGDHEMLAVARRRLGSVRMREGELGLALLDLEASVDQLRSLRLLSEAAESAVIHAQILAKLGEIRDAARERDIAAAMLEPLGSSVRNEEIAEVTRLIELQRR